MCQTQTLWLLAFLAFSSLSDGSQLEIMSAPNLLRVGAAENIFVEIQDYRFESNVNVEIIVMNYPIKTTRLASTSVTLTREKGFQDFGQIMIPATGFSQDHNMKQYVYLQAAFPNRLLEKIVLVSFHVGYIFIQTDKTLYTPESNVYYRIFAMSPTMEPVERDTTTQNEATDEIDIEIVNPDGITLPLNIVSPAKGIFSGHYQLGETVRHGLWKVVAKFHRSPQLSFPAEFEVKEYVHPSFEVKLTTMSPFFYVESQELSVNIQAHYLSGKEVDGIAYVLFGVLQAGEKQSFPSSLQIVQIQRGDGIVTLRREHITQTFKTISDLLGSSIFVAVTVLTENGGEMVEAELRGVKIVTSPYTIHLTRTAKYFQPGLTFDITVEVLNPNDTPAPGVPVVINPGRIQGHTSANGIARVTINTDTRADRLTITASTNDPRISHETQALATMVALKYNSKSNSYIHIIMNTDTPAVGDNLKFDIFLIRQGNAQCDITYLMLSRGQLVKHGRFQLWTGQILISLSIPVTKEMLPSLRIIAYYHTNDNEVVADSVWVDIKDSCMGSLRLEPTRTFSSYEPRRMFGLKVTGDPGATVGLVAVDKSLDVLNNKHRLTQEKVWDTIEKYDTGCTPGGGNDSMNVFYDAGLLFESAAAGTPHRTDLNCPTSSRRKRASTTMDASSGDGRMLNCKEQLCHSIRKRSEMDDDAYLDSNEIVSRTHFPESWMWSESRLPDCHPGRLGCDTTSFVRTVPLRDSITTWQITGISLSTSHGICVADPLEVIVQKEFFIDLRLPYSAVRGEQLEIKAILHNNSPDSIIVRVDLLEEKDVCSSAFKRQKYHQEVRLSAQSTRSVPFIIIPMKEGHYSIEVKAAVKDTSLNDGVKKRLRVVPEGILTRSVKIIRLDPAVHGVDGHQQEIVNSEIPVKDLFPHTPTSTEISVTGQEQTGVLVEAPISGISMGSLIYQPSGGGECNIIQMTSPVIATTYLDKTNQWEAVGFEKRSEALNFINIGYRNELAFRKSDGSFALFSSYPSSSWLTAYVAKVFTMANNLVPIQSSIICDAVKFLTVNAQQPDGMFIETGRIYHGEMMGDVRGADSEASMTAFCLIAMQESRSLCAATVNNLQGSIDKATHYLERRLPQLSNPYAVAMASYALANENKLNRRILYNFVSPDLSHWPVRRGYLYTLEATAYALLALVKAELFEDASPIVRWLNQQQWVGRSYGSTQATIMVYQAVAEYWTKAKEQEYCLNVDILLPGRTKPDKYDINRRNYYATRISKFTGINKNVTVTARGTGQATLKMVSLYYALPQEKRSNCQKYSLSVQLVPENTNDEERVYLLRIELLYRDRVRDATMSILDIGLLTGFIINTNDLQQSKLKRYGYIVAHEMDTILSERGSLIINLNRVSNTEPLVIAFRIHQVLKVGILQPAAVSVYEYNEPEAHCVKFYHPQRSNGELLRLCRNNECMCAEENCGKQKKGNISNDERIAKANEITLSRRIDFVYKVRVENFTSSLSIDIYTVRIMELIKDGRDDVSLEGQQCTFIGLPHCRAALDLGRGKTYLIMGSSKDFFKDEESQSYQYVSSDRTWIEYWPTDAECQTVEHRTTCLGLEEMVQLLTLFGCQN